MAARSWGVQPSEFWGMTIGEWMLEATWHNGQHEKAPRRPGVLSAGEVDRLKALIED